MPDEEGSKDHREFIVIPDGKASSVAFKYFIPSTSTKATPTSVRSHLFDLH